MVYIAKHFESITRISCDLETRRASQQSILMGTLGREKDVLWALEELRVLHFCVISHNYISGIVRNPFGYAEVASVLMM